MRWSALVLIRHALELPWLVQMRQLWQVGGDVVDVRAEGNGEVQSRANQHYSRWVARGLRLLLVGSSPMTSMRKAMPAGWMTIRCRLQTAPMLLPVSGRLILSIPMHGPARWSICGSLPRTLWLRKSAVFGSFIVVIRRLPRVATNGLCLLPRAW